MDITERSKSGDNKARRLIYEAYAGLLLGVCYRYVADHSLAQDLLHDGFVKIFTSMEQFEWRGEGSLKAWLIRVQQNVILMHLRKASKWNEDISVNETPDILDEPEPERADDIPQEVLMQFITELPEGYRTVFNMYVVDGYSHKDIAKTLGIQEKSSASQLVHARRILTKRINSWRKANK